MNKSIPLVAFFLFFFPLLSQVEGKEVWGRLSQYDSKKGVVKLKDGRSFTLANRNIEWVFQENSPGTPLQLTLEKGVYIVGAQTISSDALVLNQASIGDILSFQKNKNTRIKGELVEKNEKSFVLLPVVHGKVQRNMRVSFSLNEISDLANSGQVEFPSHLNPSKSQGSEKKDQKKDGEKKDEKKTPRVVKPETSPKNPDSISTRQAPTPEESSPSENSSSLKSLYQKLSRESPSFIQPLFRWGTRNPLPLTIGLGIFLFFLFSSLLKFLKGKEKGEKRSFGGVDAYEAIRDAQGRASSANLSPQRLEFTLKRAPHGFDIKVRTFFKESPSSSRRQWSIVFFYQGKENPEKIRFSKNDLTVQMPPGQGVKTSEQTLHLFTSEERPNIFPLIIRAKEVERYREAFQSNPMELPSQEGAGKYDKIYQNIKNKLEERRFSFLELPVSRI